MTDTNSAPVCRLTADQYRALAAPINASNVRWHGEDTDPARTPYVDGSYVCAELSRIFGFANWDDEILADRVIDESETTLEVDGMPVDGWRVIREAKVRLTVKAVDGTVLAPHDAIAVYTAEHRDRGMANHLAITSAVTIAIKIAARRIADKFGLGLLAGVVAGAYVAGSWNRPEGIPLPTAKPVEEGPVVDVLTAPYPEPDANPSSDGETPGWRRVAAAGFKFYDPAAVTDSLRKTIADAKAAQAAELHNGNGKAQAVAS